MPLLHPGDEEQPINWDRVKGGKFQAFSGMLSGRWG